MVAVKHQMLRSDGGSQPFISVTDIVGSVFGGDMLKNDFQRGQALAQRFHHAFYKARFTIKMSISAYVTSPCTSSGIPIFHALKYQA